MTTKRYLAALFATAAAALVAVPASAVPTLDGVIDPGTEGYTILDEAASATYGAGGISGLYGYVDADAQELYLAVRGSWPDGVYWGSVIFVGLGSQGGASWPSFTQLPVSTDTNIMIGYTGGNALRPTMEYPVTYGIAMRQEGSNTTGSISLTNYTVIDTVPDPDEASAVMVQFNSIPNDGTIITHPSGAFAGTQIAWSKSADISTNTDQGWEIKIPFSEMGNDAGDIYRVQATYGDALNVGDALPYNASFTQQNNPHFPSIGAADDDFAILQYISLDSVTLADADGADVLDATAATNDPAIDVQLGTVVGAELTSVTLAQDAGFSQNVLTVDYTGQTEIAYTLTAGDGSRDVFARLDAVAASSTTSDSIVLDTDVPSVSSALALQGGAATDVSAVSLSYTIDFDEAINTIGNSVSVAGLDAAAVGLSYNPGTANLSNLNIGVTGTGPYTISITGTVDVAGDLTVTIDNSILFDAAGNAVDGVAPTDSVTLTDLSSVVDWRMMEH
ncbi:hypothetical protein KQI84_16910 [bacterium]|nr:hypothetical protein [bacterium]